MSLRLQSSASQHYVSIWGGLGIPGADIPASGDNGASPLHDDGLASSAEYRIVTTSNPSAGTLTVYPDTSLSFFAPDGVYTWVFTLYEDSVVVGSETVTLAVGGSSVSLFISDALHNHSAEAPALSTALLLSLADALHNHSGDSINLDTSNSTWLVLQEASHEHSADLVSLTLNDLITIQEALHNHRAGSPQLEPGQKTLSIAEAIHLHLADNLLISIPTGALTSDSRFVITVGPRSFVITPGARFMKAMATHRTFNISSRTK